MEAGAIMTILTQHGGDQQAAVRRAFCFHNCKPYQCDYETSFRSRRIDRGSFCGTSRSFDTLAAALQGRAIAKLRTLPQMLLPSTSPMVKQLVRTSRRFQVHFLKCSVRSTTLHS